MCVQVIFPTTGVHPYHVADCGSLEEAMTAISALAAHEEGNEHPATACSALVCFTSRPTLDSINTRKLDKSSNRVDYGCSCAVVADPLV